ncbi:hypothetical protein Q5H94_05800 [Sphingomonas sp. CA1-15]|uniref:Uncharacterized protein n=2 Tax=Sphingomonas immobilis TaxID=3063997 RepID=A0ABT8ZX80_9SPHN|nr:hypothetical protein [Sphingomonas sp. CA1-15]
MRVPDWQTLCSARTFDALLLLHFGPGELDELSPEEYDAAIGRLRDGFGREQDPGRRFALWALLHLFDEAPSLEQTFDDPATIIAAHEFVNASEPVIV